MKAYRNPPNVHPLVAAYTHQIELSRDERLLVLSGQIGQREDGTGPEDPIEQLEVAWENLRRNLQAAAMDVKDMVKLTFYLVGNVDAGRRRELIATRLDGHKPLFVGAISAQVPD